MSRKANPAVIGVFVVAAVALMTAAIIIFGKGQLFRETGEWVLYFDGSIKGLSRGSPVVFQGVRIGEVKNIRLLIDKDNNLHTPVYVALDSTHVTFEKKHLKKKEIFQNTQSMIDRGLRAQLQLQSLITGQLLVQLDFHPEKKARFVAPDGPIPEIPTIRSTVQELSKIVENLPLEDIVKNIHGITQKLDKLLSSEEIGQSFAAIRDTAQRAEEILDKLDKQIDPISEQAQCVMRSADKLMTDNNEKLGTLLAEIEKTSATTRASVVKLTTELSEITRKTDEQLNHFLQTATTTTEHAGKMIEGQSQFRLELNRTLEELQAAMRAIRIFTEYMEQHPESFIRGKRE